MDIGHGGWIFEYMKKKSPITALICMICTIFANLTSFSGEVLSWCKDYCRAESSVDLAQSPCYNLSQTED